MESEGFPKSFKEQVAMVPRRYFIHMLVVFGVLTLGTAMALAAPACSSLFETLSISDVSVARTIESIARLKISVDQLKAQGAVKNSVSAKKVSADFKLKYKNLQKDLQGKMNERDLHDLIELKIQELQRMEKENSEKEAARRKSHAEKISKSIPAYRLEKSEFLDTLEVTIDDMNYLTSSGSVALTYFKNGIKTFAVLDNDTLQPKVLIESFSKALISNDGERVFVLRGDKKIEIFNINENKVINTIPLSEEKKSGLDTVSPSENLAAFHTWEYHLGNHIAIYDLVKGIEIATIPTKPHQVSDFQNMRFAGEKNLVSTRGEYIFHVSIESKEIQSRKQAKYLRAAVSADGSQIITTKTDSFNDVAKSQLLDSQTFEVLQESELPLGISHPHIYAIPAFSDYIILKSRSLTHDIASNDLVLVSKYDTSKVLFNFKGLYTGNDSTVPRIDAISLGQDGTLAISASWQAGPNKGKTRLDIWKVGKE
jgi:hypothetical protein